MIIHNNLKFEFVLQYLVFGSDGCSCFIILGIWLILSGTSSGKAMLDLIVGIQTLWGISLHILVPLTINLCSKVILYFDLFLGLSMYFTSIIITVINSISHEGSVDAQGTNLICQRLWQPMLDALLNLNTTRRAIDIVDTCRVLESGNSKIEAL